MPSCRTFIGIVCTGRPDISDAGGEPASRNITAWTGPLPEGIPHLLSDVLQRLRQKGSSDQIGKQAD